MIYPKITIGIPTYNQAHLIRECLESVVSQDYQNLEIIVLDDSSTDNTSDVVAGFSNVQYYRNETNIGRVANYRKLLYELATGDWYLNLDGDDILLYKSAISDLANCINASTDVLLVMGSGMPFNQKAHLDPIQNNSLKATIYDGNIYFTQYSNKLPFNHAACLYQRNTAIKNDFYKKNCLNTDFISIIQLCFFGKIVLLDAKIAGWRTHSNNATHNVSNAKTSPEIQAYIHLSEQAIPYIGKENATQWLDRLLDNSEKYRIRYSLHKFGAFVTFKSIFDPNQRLTKQVKLSDLGRFFYYLLHSK